MSEARLTICAIGHAGSSHVVARTRCFAERGHRVFLLSEAPSPASIEGVTVLNLAQPPGTWRYAAAIMRRLGINPDHAWRMAAFIGALRRCRPDVVHVHFAYSYYGWLAGLVGCRPLAVSVMGGDVLFDEQGSPTPTGKWLTLELLRQADYITCKSNHLISVLDRLGGFGSKSELIVWGIPLDKFRRVDSAALRAQLRLRAGQRVILSPKILQPFYRVDRVVEAMAHVVRAVPEAVLLITEYAADPEYRDGIAARVRELGLENHVRFCGHVAHADMPAYYSLAEMTVAVPSSDGLPQTLLEGMACGTPSVVSRLPRYEEIVRHAVSAYFVDADPEAIAAGIIELFNAPELRIVIARNALAIVTERASLDEQAARVERRYRQLAMTRARAWSLKRGWSVWRAYRKFRSAGAVSNTGGT